MTTLDTLARSAVTAIDESVADLPIPAAPGVAGASVAAWGTVKYALAGAAAAVAVLVALIVAAPTEDVTDTRSPPRRCPPPRRSPPPCPTWSPPPSRTPPP